MNHILRPLLDECVVVYLDDILVYSKNMKEHVEHLRKFFEILRENKFYVKLSKSDFALKKVQFLGHMVSAEGVHVDPRKIEAVKKWKVSENVKDTSGMGLVLGGRARVVLTGHADASWVDDLATQRSSQRYTFSLGSSFVSWQFTRSSSVLNSSCEAEIYDGAMAAQELRWFTYLLTNLGEAPRSPPVLYVDNKAMLALCLEHGLEHRTKHISLRYFLA
ncbi:unnamed protein product [Closterium sp. NIES-54]